jgi:hypothetical protein
MQSDRQCAVCIVCDADGFQAAALTAAAFLAARMSWTSSPYFTLPIHSQHNEHSWTSLRRLLAVEPCVQTRAHHGFVVPEVGDGADAER